MKNINFNVSKDTIEKLSDDVIISDSFNYIQLTFNFDSTWNQYNVKKATFFSDYEDGEQQYEADIINNVCIIPSEILQKSKFKDNFFVGVYGQTIKDNTLQQRNTTNMLVFSLRQGAYFVNALNPGKIDPSAYDLYLAQLQQIFQDGLNEYNLNVQEKTNNFNSNANEKTQQLYNISENVEQIEQNIEQIQKNVKDIEQNAKISENNAKTSEQNAQNSLNKAVEVETKVINIQKDINTSKAHIEEQKESVDNSVIKVEKLVDEATNQANISKEQAELSIKNANQTSTDKNETKAIKDEVSTIKTSVEQTKSDVEQIKADTQTIFDNTVQAKNDTLKAKEDVENSLENERIKSDKKYAKAIDTDEIEIFEFGEVELDEDGYMKDVEISTAKDITQNTRAGYNKLNLEKYPYSEAQSILNGSTVTLNEGILSIDATNATADVTVKSKSLAGSNRDVLVPGKYYFGVNTNGYYESNPNQLVQLVQGVVEITENYFFSQWYTTCKINEKIDKKLLLSDDVSKTEYEQFGASPSIEFPSKIKNMESNIKISNNTEDEPTHNYTKDLQLENQFLGTYNGSKNYIEKNRFKRNLNILNLTGSEKWQSHINSACLRTPDGSLDFFMQAPVEMKTSSIMLSDKFKFYNFDGGYRSNSNIESVSNGGGYRRIYIRIKKDRLGSLDVNGLKNFLKELYEKGDPVKILYITNTEYSEELSTEISDKLNSFNVYKGTNQIEIGNFKLKFKSNKSISSFVDEQLKINSELQKKEFEEQAKAIEHHITGVSNELERVKDDILETVEANDAFIHLEDSALLKMQSLSIDGACKQENTTGKNLWDYITNFVPSTSGLTISLTDDGTITVAGVPTNDYVSVLKEIDITDVLEDGETYTLTNENVQQYLYPQVSANKTDGSTTTYYTTSAVDKSFKVDKSIYTKYILKLKATSMTIWGTDSRTIKTRVMLYKGNGDNTFEPYTGGIPAPNPDYPKAISTITDSLKVTSCGKTLLSYPFRETTKTSNGITWTDNKDGTITANGTATADASFAVTYSLPMPPGTFIYKTFGLPNDCKANYYFSGTRFGEATGMTVRTSKWNAGLIITIPKGVTVSNALLKPILVAGMIVGEYEQYISSQIVSNLPENEFLGKINEEAKDTLKAVYNESDSKYHLILNKMIGKATLNGKETYGLSTTKNLTQVFFIYLKNLPEGNKLYNVKQSTNLLSDRFRNDVSGDVPVIRCLRYELYIALNKTTASTVEELKSWLAENNVEIYYELNNPYQIDLGVVDMPLTYNNVTNIFTDSDLLPNITVKYYKNFKKTIEDLKQQNNNLQTQIDEIKALLNTTNTASFLAENLAIDNESEVI